MFDGTRAPSWPLYADAPRGTVVPLREALARAWQSDAHTVPYEGGAARYGDRRLSGGAVERGVHPRCVLLALDVDDPEAHAAKAPVTPEARAALAERVEAFRAAHPGVIAYHTRGGVRLLATLAEPVVIDGPEAIARWKALVSRWIARAARAGLRADAACVDWTRFFRLPSVRRKGEMQRWPWQGSPEDLGCWPALDGAPEAIAEDLATLLAVPELRVLAKHLAPPRAARAPRGPRAPSPESRAARTPVVPLDVRAVGSLARELAEGVAALPPGTGARHTARLAVVGALAPYLDAPSLARVVEDASAASGTPVAEWDLAGRLARRERGEAIPALATLRELGAKALVEAVEGLAGETRGARWRLELARGGVLETRSADAACAELARAITATVTRSGSLLALLTTGAGKSRGATVAAVEVALAGGRAVILTPSHAVAAELRAHLAASGVRVLSLTAPQSLRAASGTPACVLHEHAAEWADAGRSVLRELCDGEGMAPREKRPPALPVVHAPAPPRDAPCVHRAGCEAYGAHQREREALAAEGPGVLVTVHAYAGAAHEWLRARAEGAPGLAVVDEDPAVARGVVLSHAQVLATAEELAGGRPYALSRAAHAWIAPMLAAVATVLADPASTDLSALPAEVLDAVRTHGWSEGSRRLRLPRATSKLRLAVVHGVQTSKLRALQRAAEVQRAVLAEELGATVAVSTDYRGDRVLAVGALDEGLGALLADPTIARVVLDATASAGWLAPWLPEAEVLRLHAADGGPVTRIAVPWAHATRRHCLSGGRPQWDELAGPLAEGLALAAEGLARGARVLAVTWRPVVRALAGERGDLPPRVRDALDALDARGVSVAWAHYGSVRGRDEWRGADAVLALGTPYPEGRALDALAGVARARRGWAGSTRDLGLHAARAELAQVIGRLRLPRRASHARVVVVASELPLGADARWAVRELPTGRPRVLAAEAVASVAGLSLRAAAAALGAAVSTVRDARERARVGVCGNPVRERDASERDCTAFPHTPMEAQQVPENASESGVPATHEPQGARLTIAEAEAQAAYEDAEVAAGGWQGLAPPARVVPELALACAAEGAPLALRWADPPVLAVPVALSPATAAEVRREAAPLALLLARRSPEDSAHEWPADERERYGERVAILTADGTPDHLAERAAAWWVWAGPWPERAAPYARARGAA